MQNTMKQKYVSVLLCILLLLCLPSGAFAVVDAPADVYVGDYANVLSESTERYIIAENQKLAEATGAQIVVVTVDFLDGIEIEDYAYKIFNDWGIGDADRNNGLLLLLAIGEDNYYAMQGAGIERVLSSGTLGDYLYDYLEDDFAAGDYDAGVNDVFDAFLEWFYIYYDLSATGTVNNNNNNNNDYAGTVGGTYENNADDYDNDADWIVWLIVILIIILLISMNNRRKDQNNKKNNRRGGSGGGRSHDDDWFDDYDSQRRTNRRTVYVPTGGTGRTTTSRNSRPSSFGGGSTRGGGAGRRSTGGFGGSSVGRSSFGGGSRGGFGGGSSRGGGAGRR